MSIADRHFNRAVVGGGGSFNYPAFLHMERLCLFSPVHPDVINAFLRILGGERFLGRIAQQDEMLLHPGYRLRIRR